jgi:hypothetical protein
MVLADWRARLVVGGAGGLLGGVVMAAFSVSLALARGHGMWMPVKLIGGIVLGPGAVNNPSSFSLSPILTGLAVHVAVSVLLGSLFALLASWLRLPPVTLVLYGMVYALVIWFVALFFVLPMVYPLFANNTNPALFALSHILYGLTLGWWMGERG